MAINDNDLKKLWSRADRALEQFDHRVKKALKESNEKLILMPSVKELAAKKGVRT